MIRTRRLTRTRAAVLVAGTLAVASGVVAVRRATAYVPASRYTEAIDAAMRDSPARDQFAAGRVVFLDRTGPDGIAGYDGTPDRRGAFVFFDYVKNTDGARGRGAIYAFTYTSSASRAVSGAGGPAVAAGSVKGQIIWDAVLPSWSARGWETGYGYPVTDYRPATDRDVAAGCATGDSAQWFHRISGGGATSLVCVTGAAARWIRV